MDDDAAGEESRARSTDRDALASGRWASALCIAGGLLIVTGGIVLLTLYEGADLPLGMATDQMERQLHASGKPPVLLAAWAIAPGAVAAFAGYRLASLPARDRGLPGAVAVLAGLVAIGPGGGFLWGTILTVLGGSLALAASLGAR